VKAPRRAEILTAYREELGPKERSLLLAWLSFTVTFAVVRTITYSIKHGVGPFGNVSVGGAHLHHYMWGLLLLAIVGAIAVRGDDSTRWHPLVATAYGVGVALIVDEYALLLNLQDVYWAKQGKLSIDIAIGLIALGATGFAAIPIVRRLRRDLAGTNKG
jgi:hypothetical protein